MMADIFTQPDPTPLPPQPVPCAFKYSFFQYTVFSIRMKQTWLEYTVFQNYAVFRNRNFRDCVNPLCNCSLESSLVRFFSALSLFHRYPKKTLFNELLWIDENTLNQSENKIVKLLLLYSNQKVKFQQNCSL